MPQTTVSGPGPGKTPATGTVTPGPARGGGNKALTWLHKITVPFTRGICLGCWLDWHLG